jgi:hypothetical protein
MNTDEQQKLILNRITAYQLVIDSLPQPSMWFRAVQARLDDTTAAGIFSVLAELRMELQIQIGDLRENPDSTFEFGAPSICEQLSASTMDRVTAYQLAMDSLPRPAMWFLAIGRRKDGTTPEDIFNVLDEIRMSLQVRIGDLRADPIRNAG